MRKVEVFRARPLLKISNSVSMLRAATLLVTLANCCPAILAQNPQLQTRNGQRFPTIVFSSVLWNANPSSYSFAIDSTGAATYQSAPNSVDTTGVPYTVVFQSDPPTRRIIFNAARTLDFFRGDFPVTLGTPQKDPIRTLSYHDSTFDNQITFSESTNPQIQELLSVFEEISTTLEFGRRLANFHQNDKSRLEPELANMQQGEKRHRLRELQAVAAVLRRIVSDQSLPKSVREQAQAVLDGDHSGRAGSGSGLFD